MFPFIPLVAPPSTAAHQLVNDENEPWRWWFVPKDPLRDTKNAAVELDAEAGLLHGEIINLSDVVTFQGRSIDELRQAFKESVEDYLEACAEFGKEPEKPFTGQFVVRVRPEVHH